MVVQFVAAPNKYTDWLIDWLIDIDTETMRYVVYIFVHGVTWGWLDGNCMAENLIQMP